MVPEQPTRETKIYQYSIPSLTPIYLLVQREPLVSWALTSWALRFHFVNTQSISIPAQLVAVSAASHTALAGINCRSACSEGVSTPTLSAILGSEIGVSGTEGSACLQCQVIGPKQIGRQSSLCLAISNASDESIVSNGTWLLRSGQVRIVVQRQTPGSTAGLGWVARASVVALCQWSQVGSLNGLVTAVTLSAPLGAKVWVGRAEGCAFREGHVVGSGVCGGECTSIGWLRQAVHKVIVTNLGRECWSSSWSFSACWDGSCSWGLGGGGGGSGRTSGAYAIAENHHVNWHELIVDL